MTLLFPVYSIATPQELVLPCEKNIDPFNSSAHFFWSAKDEWVSCKNKIFKYSNIWIFLREFCSLFTAQKKHISQVLEYHEKFKNIKKLSTFRQLYRSKNDRISYLWKVQNKNFSVLKKMVFHAEENIILHQLFESKEERISHLQKIQNKNFSVFRKYGIPRWRKHHLKSTFWTKRNPYFPSPKSSKQELSHNLNFSFRAKCMFF